MEENWFTAEKQDEGTWLIKGADGGCSSYLLEGENKAIMIDSGFGNRNICAFAQTLTKKPLSEVANTHGHFDHTGGNGWFDKAYMSAQAQEIAMENMRARELPSAYNPNYFVQVVESGERIELGGRDIEVLPLGIHSPGSVAFLDRAHRVLFVGDDIGNVAMLCYKISEPQPSIALYAQALGVLMAKREYFDFCCNGHGDAFQNAGLVNDCLCAALQVLDGTQDHPVTPLSEEERKGSKFSMPGPEFKREAIYGAVKIIYDVRYINDYTRYSGLKGT